jgi:xanthine dehydrogenase accessory factor
MNRAIAPDQFVTAAGRAIRVMITEAKGSTPREAGAFMLVGEASIWGTIGGGRVEFMAIAQAREMLAEAMTEQQMDIPLGPEIGQCCGGRVLLTLEPVTDHLRQVIVSDWRAAQEQLPHVLLFGAGHVGRALFAQLSALPVSLALIDTRVEAVQGFGSDDRVRLMALPEQAIDAAPSGSAFIVLTHEHALDFLLTTAALRRADAAYVGMIGSQSKRATLRTHLLENGLDRALINRLHCPIGASKLADKRPAVIAAMTIAEVLPLLSWQDGNG